MKSSFLGNYIANKLGLEVSTKKIGLYQDQDSSKELEFLNVDYFLKKKV
jgi:hypothetical protein